jgi:hypothetical protein
MSRRPIRLAEQPQEEVKHEEYFASLLEKRKTHRCMKKEQSDAAAPQQTP